MEPENNTQRDFPRESVTSLAMKGIQCTASPKTEADD